MDPDERPARDEESDWQPRIDIEALYEDLGESGLLTRSDRELLLGLKDYESPQRERKDRARMRGRIRTALKDFDLLAREIDPRDREQIIADITDFSEYPDNAYRTDEVQGMASAMALFYAVANEADFDFARVIEHGIFTALRWSLQHQAPYPDVTVEISIEPIENHEDLYGKLREEENLREHEYHLLLREVIGNRARFVLETEEIELPLDEAQAADCTLSRDQSLIAIARWLVDPDWLDVEMDAGVIDSEVLRDFGFPTGRSPTDGMDSENAESGKGDEKSDIEDIVDEL